MTLGGGPALRKINICDLCNGRGESILGASVRSSKDEKLTMNDSRNSRRKLQTRKDADHEFFCMSLLSYTMTHKK